MKKYYILAAFFCLIAPVAMTQPTGLRYGDIIPRKDLTYDIGHKSFWYDRAYIKTTLGNERDIEATIPAAAFVDEKVMLVGGEVATFDGINWHFPNGVTSSATSVYFQIPASYNKDIHTISVSIGWISNSKNTALVDWLISFVGAKKGNRISVLASTQSVTPNAGSNRHNISKWVSMDTPDVNSTYCGYIEISRLGGSSEDSFTGDAILNYIQIKLPVKNQ